MTTSRSDISTSVLILGGTREARHLTDALVAEDIAVTYSLAGRVKNPIKIYAPTRVGGFGGVAGLRDYIAAHAITHVIDATHPFAAQMSHNAFDACTDVPLLRYARAPWQAGAGDAWMTVADVAKAAEALRDRPAQNVFLAIGRQNIDAFTIAPQHRYLLRMVETPEVSPALPDHTLVVGRGPFAPDAEADLLATHEIDLLVSKNAGGATAAKLIAARERQINVLMIDRPPLPEVETVANAGEVLAWLHAHGITERGV